MRRVLAAACAVLLASAGARTQAPRVFVYVEHYEHNAAIGLFVPSRMREVYDYTGVVDDFIEAEATYSNYRRFETESRVLGFEERR